MGVAVTSFAFAAFWVLSFVNLSFWLKPYSITYEKTGQITPGWKVISRRAWMERSKSKREKTTYENRYKHKLKNKII